MSDAAVPFEKHRFRGAAVHYLSGRPAYAPSLFRRVAERVGLRSGDRVLDLGCGPGQIALGFAGLKASVTAIDPEPEMLAIARACAAAAELPVGFVEASSYDLGPRFGRFRLVAIGRAFHWMDRIETARRLDEMIEPEGAIALFGDRHPEMQENAWRKAYDAVLEKYSADDPARRQRKSDDWPAHEQVLLGSPFPVLERIGVLERRHTPIGSIADRILSLSSVNRERLGSRSDEMVAELMDMLAPFATGGAIVEVVESQALLAMRPSPPA